MLDRNIQTDVIFLDFAKAFDSVDHTFLLKKLKSYGISGNMSIGLLIIWVDVLSVSLSMVQLQNGLKSPLVSLRVVS